MVATTKIKKEREREKPNFLNEKFITQLLQHTPKTD